jgi:hypothetical protein
MAGVSGLVEATNLPLIFYCLFFRQPESSKCRRFSEPGQSLGWFGALAKSGVGYRREFFCLAILVSVSQFVNASLHKKEKS